MAPRLARLGVSVVAGVVCLAVIVAATGIVTRPIGAADNGDGARLYCGAGITPATPNGRSNWKGGVVLEFARSAPCSDPIPSSALTLLRASASQSPTWYSLTRLGWLYALAASAVAAAAAWAATAGGLRRVLVLTPPVLPLADSHYARFFLSTFSEPAGLLGAFTLFCGAAALAVSRPGQRAARVIALVLVAAGGLLAVTAKTAYAPLLLLAAAICATTVLPLRGRRPAWTARVAGPVLAGVLLLAAVPLVREAMQWQARHYPAVNTHNLIYTLLLTEIPRAEVLLGLPPEAQHHAGSAFYPRRPYRVPGADEIAQRPAEMRNTAWRVLAAHPLALARAVGVGTQATRGADLSYLPSGPWTPRTIAPQDVAPAGQQGANAPSLRAWLDGMRAPGWPMSVVLAGCLAGLAGLARRTSAWSMPARIAGAAAVSAAGLVLVAVLGDGYFEIAKHVWLAAYLLDVALLALIGAALTACVTATSSSRAPRNRAGGAADVEQRILVSAGSRWELQTCPRSHPPPHSPDRTVAVGRPDVATLTARPDAWLRTVTSLGWIERPVALVRPLIQ